MAWESLADFFAVGPNCNNQELIKAVARCARGPYRESLRKAALTCKELESYLAGHSPIPPPNRPRPPTNQPQQSKEWLRVEQENKQRFQTWLAKVKQENQHNG